ncbi:Modulator of levamisole receptor-1 [Cryptosporidium felis]|nr:Modulator of levamisole receptor-1 [Cryptosporidium felis]
MDIYLPLFSGRGGRISSRICDPSRLLSGEEGDYIDTLLEDIQKTPLLKCGEATVGYNIGVAVVPPSMGDGGEIANKLLDSWSMREVDCSNNIIFVYLSSENRAVVRWGSSVEPALNIVMYPELISEIDSVFVERPIGPGIYSGISTIRSQLRENIGPPRRLPQLLVLAIIGGLTVLGFGALVVSAISEYKPLKSSTRTGRRLEAQEILHRIQLMLKNGSIDKDLCPITLIDLDRTGIPYVICNKGYKYEARSYMECYREKRIHLIQSRRRPVRVQEDPRQALPGKSTKHVPGNRDGKLISPISANLRKENSSELTKIRSKISKSFSKTPVKDGFYPDHFSNSNK